jgi:23S rRNA pseudouridine1911/1915/1917 synthase
VTTRSLPVPEGLAGERLDAALSRLLGVSRTKAVELVENGGVLVDGITPAKSDRVAAGAWLEVHLPEVSTAPPVEARTVEGLDVIHEDGDIIVIDKPIGVAAHPSPGWAGPTVVGHLAASGRQVATSGAAERQGVVHRLDAGTSGLMVVAKSERAYSSLKRAFKERTVDKTYHALVQGHPDPFSGTVDAPIARHPRSDWKFAVVAGGRESITHYDTLEAHRFATLLEIRLETGRTHQIRVHMAALQHPCVGDLTYGADPTLAARVGLSRQWLHAMRLAFDHPGTGERVEFSSRLPADLTHALEVIRHGQ